MIIVLALWRRTIFVETTWLTQERTVTVVEWQIDLLMVPVYKTGAAMGHHVVLALMWSAGESLCNVTVGYVLVPFTSKSSQSNTQLLSTIYRPYSLINTFVTILYNCYSISSMVLNVSYSRCPSPPLSSSPLHFTFHLLHSSSIPLPTALDKVFAATLPPACLFLMVQWTALRKMSALLHRHANILSSDSQKQSCGISMHGSLCPCISHTPHVWNSL